MGLIFCTEDRMGPLTVAMFTTGINITPCTEQRVDPLTVAEFNNGSNALQLRVHRSPSCSFRPLHKGYVCVAHGSPLVNILTKYLSHTLSPPPAPRCCHSLRAPFPAFAFAPALPPPRAVLTPKAH